MKKIILQKKREISRSDDHNINNNNRKKRPITEIIKKINFLFIFLGKMWGFFYTPCSWQKNCKKVLEASIF